MVICMKYDAFISSCCQHQTNDSLLKKCATTTNSFLAPTKRTFSPCQFHLENTKQKIHKNSIESVFIDLLSLYVYAKQIYSTEIVVFCKISRLEQMCEATIMSNTENNSMFHQLLQSNEWIFPLRSAATAKWRHVMLRVLFLYRELQHSIR